MKHIEKLFVDMILELVEAFDRIVGWFRKPQNPSLIAANIFWCTNSEWMDRLTAYKQLELWTDH